MSAEPLSRKIVSSTAMPASFFVFDLPAEVCPAGQGYFLVKRLIDMMFAAVTLVFALPLLLLLAILIKCDTAGPALFRQTRLGLNGKPFEVLKLRTMTVQENGVSVAQAHRDDPRVTRIGRFLRAASLDELPQLINVLKGEMSLVGPRPHAVAHDRHFGRVIPGYAGRQAVKPGITGWAQVNGARGETATIQAMETRVALDLWYVRHADLALDLRILLRTPVEVLKARNAY